MCHLINYCLEENENNKRLSWNYLQGYEQKWELKRKYNLIQLELSISKNKDKNKWPKLKIKSLVC